MNDQLSEFLATQVEMIRSGDAAGLALRYAEDAEFVRFDRVANGRAEIRELLSEYLRRSPTVLERQAVATTEDVIFYRVRQLLDDREVVAVGTLVFRDGLVWRQTVAFADAAEVAPTPSTAAS